MNARSSQSTAGCGLFALCLLAAALPARALQISSLTPQGEVAQVRQVVASFDQAAGFKSAPGAELTGSRHDPRPRAELRLSDHDAGRAARGQRLAGLRATSRCRRAASKRCMRRRCSGKRRTSGSR